MKLATRLLAAPLLAAGVALTVGGAYGVLMHQQVTASHAAASSDTTDYKALAQSQAQLGQVHASVYRTLAILNSFDEAKTKAFTDDTAKQIAGAKGLTQALVAHGDHDAALTGAITAALPLFDKYAKQVAKAVELTSVEVNMGVAAMKAAENTHVELTTALGQVVARVDALSAEHIASAAARQKNTTMFLAILALLATGAAVGWSWNSQRRLVRELGRAASVAEEVASGNLGVQLHTTQRDEIGDLMRSLDRMVHQLRDSLYTVTSATDTIRSAAAEIASGNAELSHRTEETASSLQQTASAMTELTSTVRQSADSAAQANQLAASAAEVARRGGDVVSKVVVTMDQINSSSRKIADIIGTIDGIAFQTNILALNAAVEAARAGEQGRGFAVVAGEVRNLAQRSAEAAREIKSLIGASVDSVESGSKLVSHAGTTMTEIVSSVQRVADIVTEISAAATEQSSGIGQVDSAVSQLDQMTQQNTALVEQSAAAAESLSEQATRLADVLSRFKLGASPAAEMAAPAAAPAPKKVAAQLVAQLRGKSARPAAATTPGRAVPAATAPAPAKTDDDWESF